MRLSGQDLRAGMAGEEVAELHAELIQLGFTVPDGERREHIFGVATAQAVAAFQKAHGLWDTAMVDRNTAAALARAIAEANQETVLMRPLAPAPVPPPPLPSPDPVPPGQEPTAFINGRVYLDYGGPAADVTLRAYRRGFGGTATLVGATATAADGSYRLGYDVGDGVANLELRAVQANGEEVSLTLTAFAVEPGQVLNLVAPSSVRPPLGAEYRRLVADVEPQLDGRRLGEATQTEEQPDLTLLQETTGWDARLVALAARADRLSATTGVAAPAVYAMLRAGLPDDPAGLAGVSVSAVDRALGEATKAGVVDLDEAGRRAAVSAFTSFARATRLATVAPGALSSQAEMLAVAGLTGESAARFDEIYEANAQRGGDAAQLWHQVGIAGLPVEALQLTGKLGYLTLNNAALTTRLRREVSGALGPALVSRQLYRPQAWIARLTEAAGGDGENPSALVPPAYRGATPQARVLAYANDLARKVRVSYPTNVVGHEVATGAMNLPGADPAVRPAVATFLDRAAALGLVLGRTPMSAMVRDHGDRLLAGVPAEQTDAVLDNVRTLQRIYQITPSDGAMKVLLANGFRSAFDVTAMPRERFLARHGTDFSTVEEATLVYAKAQQVSSVTFAVVGAAKQLDSSPPVFAMAATADAREAAKDGLIATFPTMEQLFGSMDYCECDHCRSVLSPAAYLVDLLHFLDPPADQWQADVTRWQADHAAPYPFADALAWQDFQDQWAIDHPHQPVPDTTLTPYEVLTRRRPDLAQLPLTCENTNTAMPYLDAVNEILEFYVAHGHLAPHAVRDTGDALAADLLAEPQFLIPEAYDTLSTASYPLPLPFDLWVETVRELLTYFGTPLWQVLEAFRRDDALYPADPRRYGQAAVAIERLGLSGAEYALLTDTDPMARWPERYGYPAAAQAQALTELANAKNLARRLGVTYQELLDLVTTGFVNPRLAMIAALPKLGLGISDVLRYQGAPGHAPFSPEERAAFEVALAPIGGPAGLGDLWDADELAQILVLADPYAGCGFDTTTLQYADGRPADAVAFLTLNYLVRLWRRLGWSLTETDRALQVFLPTDPDPRTAPALGPAVGSALLGLSGLEALRPHVKGGRTELLEVWSDLTATRYAELFLVSTPPPVDPVFDQPLGRYLEYLDGGTYRPFRWDPGRPESLADGNVGLVNHLSPVQAALQLSADDVSRILVDAGTTVEAAPLDMATVSLLHRYGVLARGLRMPVAELITVRQITGLDPFAHPDPGPVSTLAEDRARVTVDFVDAVVALRSQDLSVTEVDYLLRHRYDPAGPYQTASAAPLSLVRTLDAAITRIQTEHADPVDPTALTDDELRQKMALVLPADTVERFFGMWTQTITYDAVTTGVDPAEQLDPAAVADKPMVVLSYDPVRAEQHLIYLGVLVERDKQRLVADHPGPADATARYAALLESVQATARDFFDLNLLAPVGFLEPVDYDAFFTPPRPTMAEADLQVMLTDRRTRLIKAFLPYLRDRLIDQAVLSTVAAEFPDETVLATSLVTEPELLADRLWPGEALLRAYRAAGDRGLDATADTAAQTASVDTYFEVAAAGSYRFAVLCDRAGTAVEMRFDHLTDALLLVTTTADGEEPAASLDLTPGTLYHVRLDATSTGGGVVTVLVMGENLPNGPLDRLTTHPAASVERVRRAHVLVDKAIRLATATELIEPELRHLLTHPDDFGGLSLGTLPVAEAEDDPTQATALFAQVRRLMDHGALRRDLGAAPGELTGLFAYARRSYPVDLGREAAAADLLADMCSRVAVLTRRDALTVTDAADRLGLSAEARGSADIIDAVAPPFVNEVGLRRLWTVLKVAGRLGVTPGVLATTATPTPGVTVARGLRDAVRAGYDVTAWRRVAQPIFDRLRQRRRDALVAWVMHADGFDRIEQLFEYFLVDPGTEPVVQISRLRLAISAVQLFIQRCLLNLEPSVHASSINSEHWQWMKRYRVWEANRKIFLWPENWLEPEFRDDKTHLFQALEGSLFQSDVTNDLAEGAFFDYLRSLEALARLDIRAIYVEEKSDPAANTLHVLGRTFGSPHAYFYRTHAYGMWTPWVPVTAEIEGDSMVLAVWRDRPHLFWVTFLDRAVSSVDARPPMDMGNTPADELLGPRTVEAYLHWTEYYQSEWTDPVSGGLVTPISAEVARSWSARSETIHVSHDGDALLVHLSGQVNRAFRVESKNSPPISGLHLPPPMVPYPTFHLVPLPGSPGDVGLADATNADIRLPLPFSVEYVDRVTTTDTVAATPQEHTTTAQILGEGWDYTVRVAGNPLTTLTAPDPEIAALVSPVFYQDDQHTFHVEPALTETTLEDWGDWAVPPVTLNTELDADPYWEQLELTGQVPAADPVPADPISAVARYQIQPLADWVTRPGSSVAYDGSVIVGRPDPTTGRANGF